MGERGGLFCKSLCIFAIHLIKESLPQLHPLTGPYSKARPNVQKEKEKEKKRLWKVDEECKNEHHTWGSPFHSPQSFFPSSNSSGCQQGLPQRARSLCNLWLGWENREAGSPGTIFCPLHSTAWTLVRSQWSVLISLSLAKSQVKLCYD